MIDISYYNEKNANNAVPDLTKVVMTTLIKCSNNKLRFISKPIKMPHVGYYHYDFESDKDIVIDTSEGECSTNMVANGRRLRAVGLEMLC